jgi:hypothetical protein
MEKTFEQEMEDFHALQARRLAKAKAYLARINAAPSQLVGSPAQVKWAEDIRSQFLAINRPRATKVLAGRETFQGSELAGLRRLAEDLQAHRRFLVYR